MTLLLLILAASPLEEEALGKAAAELARAMSEEGSREEGRRIALLLGHPAPPRRGPRASAAEVAAAHERAARILLDLADAQERAGDEEGFERNLTRALTLFPATAAPAGVAWFEPYLRWMRSERAERLARGDERVDGIWMDRAGVDALDRAHATWAAPWVVSDGVHEVRTTLPLRTARRVLAHASAFRAFLLAEFAGDWDLRAPRAPMPILVTATQAEFEARTRENSPGGAMPALQGAAYYLWSSRRTSPCLVTFEPKDATGTTSRIGFEQLLVSLRHELAHQIAFEYSRHAAANARPVRHQFWAVEGFAEFCSNLAPSERGFRLRHARRVPGGTGYFEGNFAYCQRNLERLPAFGSFVAAPRDEFATPEAYHMGATAAYFLLEGDGGAHRAGFLRLLQTVHRMDDRPDSFARAFPGIRPADLQPSWEAFVRAIRLEE